MAIKYKFKRFDKYLIKTIEWYKKIIINLKTKNFYV